MILPLPQGITGFHHYRQDPPPVVDIKRFISDCYQAAQQAQAIIIASCLAQTTIAQNYHVVTAQRGEEVFQILCNAHYPYIAFRFASNSLFLALTDARIAPLASWFTSYSSFVPLDQNVLDQMLSHQHLIRLSPVEHDQIRGWKPATIGAVIFNNWD